MRRENKDNSGIISIFLHLNIYCYPSLEPSQRDGSNEGSQHMFSQQDKNKYLPITPVTSSYLAGQRSAIGRAPDW